MDREICLMKENEKVTLRSSILQPFMRHILWKGTLLGGIGVASLLIGGIFIPLQEMKIWGPLLFIFSLALITIGLLPYKRLKRLEEHPYVLTIDGMQWLHFSAKGKPLFSIPICSIDHIDYIDKGNMYGIGVFLKTPLSKKLVVQDRSFNLAEFRKRSLAVHQCELFLSYFSRRSFATLQEHLNS